MISQELLELKKVVENERIALINGAIEEILKWASYKARLAKYLKDKELTPQEKRILKEIIIQNEHNKKIIQAGINFIEEAYRFLTDLLEEKEIYGINKIKREPKIFSKTA
ncbi:MAG: hypothetical protein DRP29_04640 [Thermodesulfobacteriota bacterium]|nr:MAG: hypothetical protein DRP29_04640 [Thermodesulfobacteriota bacterium]